MLLQTKWPQDNQTTLSSSYPILKDGHGGFGSLVVCLKCPGGGISNELVISCAASPKFLEWRLTRPLQNKVDVALWVLFLSPWD